MKENGNRLLDINSDDFYGKSSYQIASKFIDKSQDDYEYLTVNYPFNLTMSKNGKVNRGVVTTDDVKNVLAVAECSIEVKEDKIIAKNLVTEEEREILPNQSVSLNFYVFKPTIFKFLERDFKEFIQQDIGLDKEFFLTDVINKCLINKEIKYIEEISSSKWLGVTYKEDIELIKKDIEKLIEDKEYPLNLWEE